MASVMRRSQERSSAIVRFVIVMFQDSQGGQRRFDA